MTSTDTIVAVASAPGRAAVAIIRVSGAAVPHIALQLLGRLPSPRLALLTSFLDADGSSLDEGLALYFPAPASFTGEHVLELQGHGGTVILDMLLERLLHLGCRAARAGEFSERAYLNGKLDIAQAEAIADLIDAGSTAAARAAVRSLRGEFSARIEELRDGITSLRCYVEAAIDFPDEEVDFLNDTSLQSRLTDLFLAFDSISAAAHQGAVLREGLNVVIAGRPNAGKSSLLNRLVGDDVAIVTHLPGTTRDVLKQHLHIDGLPLNLIDTAGLRDSTDIVEAEGIRRARGEINRADRLLYVVDAAEAAEELLPYGAPNGVPYGVPDGVPDGVPVTVIYNKIDLSHDAARVDEAAEPPRIYLSAKTGQGVEFLRAHLKAAAGYQPTEAGAYAARRRHLDALARARVWVERAADTLSSSRAFELFAEDLRSAQSALGEITGAFTSDDLLGEIFGSFCIGK